MKHTGMTPAALTALAIGDYGNFAVASTPGGIERQEAQGQADLVRAASRLPLDCPREHLEALGFRFGEPAEGIFISAVFPAGWTLKATNHSMYSDLLDDKGRVRGGVFYKAAFYDRKARMHGLKTRYRIERPWDDTPMFTFTAQDFDGSVLFASEEVPQREGFPAVKQDAAENSCKDWLTANYPDWQNPIAYW